MTKKLLLTLLAFTFFTFLNAQQIDTLTGPTGSQQFGFITLLPNGNFVVYDPNFNEGTFTAVGAVYLFNGADNSLISTLKGSNTNDRVGSGGITVLSNSNFIVRSQSWNGNRGAATWGDGSTGISGVVSSTNSLVGGNANDYVGQVVTALSNSNYVVSSQYWNGSRGAATWGDGTTGITGTVSSSNSLVGSNANDRVSNNGIIALSNGNYVVASSQSNGARGSATWGNGTTGIIGTISSSNSLVGSNANDYVGSGITALNNGNYVVRSENWNNNRGAATWGDGTSGISGEINSNNSLVGSNDNDRVGYGSSLALSNSNYVVSSQYWNGSRGAATWGDGTTGIVGIVSSANSLVGSNANDYVGQVVTALSNSNYVVSSQYWNGSRGAVTWGNGISGVSGLVNSSNSLIGSKVNDRVGNGSIAALSNGNYVVRSENWNGNRGAVTWVNGTTGIFDTINANNSLIGSNINDNIGTNGIYGLSNGNFVVCSPAWNSNRGAATWGNGTTGVNGFVSSSNSLVGGNENDYVGINITNLNNGNYVVRSNSWNDNRGAVTWGNGSIGITGTISSSNSLIGSNVDDKVGSNGVIVLNNGNYVVRSENWNNNRGAATWGNGTTGVIGVVSSNNSLVGNNANDIVGIGGITVLNNGNYVVRSPTWNGFRGAATWGNGNMGISGTISSNNSLVGSYVTDQVGSQDVKVLNNGNYVLNIRGWNNYRGAVSISCGASPIIGIVDSINSLLGSLPNMNLGKDQIEQNTVYDNVIISSRKENKVYIHTCPQTVVCNLSSALPTLAGTYTATNSGTDGNYTCYCDASNQLLLALDTNGTRAVITSDSVKLQIGNTVTTGWSNAGGIITNPNGGVVFNRKWDVKPVVQPSSPVKVKFFFTQAEYDSVRLRLGPMGTNIISPTQLEMYKLNNLSFGDPHASGTNGIIFLNGNSPSISKWFYESNGANHSAVFLVNNINGGGGGGGSLYQEPTSHIKQVAGQFILFYPNPSFGQVMVQMPETDNASIEVVNLLGSVVHKINQAAAQTTLDLSHLAKGVYIIKINIEGVVSHNKIVLE